MSHHRHRCIIHPPRRRWVTRQEHDRRRRLADEAYRFVEAINGYPHWTWEAPPPDWEVIMAYQPLLLKRVHHRYTVEQYYRVLKYLPPYMPYLFEIRQMYMRRKYIFMYLCKVFVVSDIAEVVTQFVFIEDPW